MEKIQALFPIRGFCLRGVQAKPQGDHYELAFDVADRNGQLTVVLRLPKPNQDDIYDIEGVSKVIVLEGRRGIEYAAKPNDTDSIWVRGRDELLIDLVGKALDATLVSAAMGSPPADQVGQDVIDRFFATSPLVRQVDPEKRLDLEMTCDIVHIDVSDGSLDAKDREIANWPGMVDPLTTPQGSRAMQTFQLAGGARVEDGRIRRGDKIMSATMGRCLLFPENTLPMRLLITRSALAKHEQLIRAEDPWTRHEDYREGDLRGIHLYTATMADRYNYSDCITISESAAQKMSCIRRLYQTITDTRFIEVLVREDQIVRPGEPVARVYDGLDAKGEPKYREVETRRLVTNAVVTGVERLKTHMLGEPAEKVRIKYMCTYMLEEGSKLSTRFGTKGLVRIRPDIEFPVMGNGRRADILLHPLSLVGRRPLGLLREMMCNKLSHRKGTPIPTKHFSDELSMKELVGMGLGKKQPATVRGWRLQHPVFAGWLYWLRLDAHAREQVSAIGSIKPLNFIGLNPDAGKVSGQRINLGMATVMHAKGLKETHRVLHGQNVESGAVRLIEDLMGVLAYTGQARRER